MRVRSYIEHQAAMPQLGNHINAAFEDGNIAVYQAYKKSIANFAVKEQRFGGGEFSFNRMSWIKTSFLWMMFRSGWGQKEGQESILQVWMPIAFFEKILADCVISSFSTEYFSDHQHWKKQLEMNESRLQWDPDHDPFGNPLSRKAIQLGLKGQLLKEYATTAVVKIFDMTPFVQEQYSLVTSNDLTGLQIPHESLYVPSDKQLINRIKLTL